MEHILNCLSWYLNMVHPCKFTDHQAKEFLIMILSVVTYDEDGFSFNYYMDNYLTNLLRENY